MKKSLTLALVLVALAVFASLAVAQDLRPYRSVSISALRSDALIGSATTTVSPGSNAVQKAAAEASGLTSAAASPNPSLANLLLTNPNFASLQVLLADSRMARIDATLRHSLMAEGQRLVTERDSLLPQARKLDSRNEAIWQESERLNAANRQHKVEHAGLQKLLDEHNAQCSPAPNDAVYQWCLRNEAALTQRIDSYNQRIAEHNGKVEDLGRKSAELSSVWNAFWKTASAWEDAVMRLGEKIWQLLETPTPTTEKCQYLARSTGNLCIYSCPSGIRHWPPDANGECQKPDAHLPIEGSGVGAKATFVR